MPVGGKDIFDFKPLTIRIAFGLLHAFEGIFTLFFGFKDPYGKRFGHIAGLHAQQVVGTARASPATTFKTGGFDRGRGFQFESLMIGIPFFPQNGIDKKVPGFLFIVAHIFSDPRVKTLHVSTEALSFDY